jgi:nucleotide-binding universal stress UspA family protein
MYQRILVPLDGSDLAECTLFHVESLADHGYAGEVTLMNVVKIDIPWAEMYEKKQPIDLDGIRKKLMGVSEQYLNKVASQLTSKGIKVKTKSIEANRPAYTIMDYAKENDINLIVMATHGHTGLKKLIMGSVASSVLHESSIPVLLIRPESCTE